jgi:hypothetical protein
VRGPVDFFALRRFAAICFLVAMDWLRLEKTWDRQPHPRHACGATPPFRDWTGEKAG